LEEVFDEAGRAPPPAAAPKPRLSIAPVGALPDPVPQEEHAFAREGDWFEVAAAPDEDDDAMADGTEFVF
jgi:hypothetical protein